MTSLQRSVPAGLSSALKKSGFFRNFVRSYKNLMVDVKAFMISLFH